MEADRIVGTLHMLAFVQWNPFNMLPIGCIINPVRNHDPGTHFRCVRDRQDGKVSVFDTNHYIVLVEKWKVLHTPNTPSIII